MLKSFLSLVLLITAGLFSSAADAQWFGSEGVDRGTYRCEWCPRQSPLEGIDGQAAAFIFASVNPNLSDPRWYMKDTVTICNGTWCTTYMWTGTTWITQSFGADNGRATSGDKRRRTRVAGPFEQEVGTQCFAPTVFGHYEWYDYYSDGNYIGSSDRVFIVTNTIPGSHMNCT
jgi:hypothetical protein